MPAALSLFFPALPPRSFPLRASLFAADGNGYVVGQENAPSQPPPLPPATRLAASDDLFNSRQGCFREGGKAGRRYRPPIQTATLSPRARALLDTRYGGVSAEIRRDVTVMRMKSIRGQDSHGRGAFARMEKG